MKREDLLANDDKWIIGIMFSESSVPGVIDAVMADPRAQHGEKPGAVCAHTGTDH